MIQRIALFKLKDEYSNDATRTEVVARTRSDLGGLECIVDVAVGVPADAHAFKGWDLCLMVRFESLDDFDVYVDHPVHRAYVDDYLQPRLAMRKAWNFAID
ncbi:MAG: Dabb family protein [Polyangiales bacterium]